MAKPFSTISVQNRIDPMKTFLLMFLWALCAASTAQAQSEAAIESVLVRQAEAWNRADIPGYMEGYWRSDSLLFTSGAAIQRGWKATLEKYSKSYSTPAKMGILKFSGLEIRQLSEQSAWVFGRWELRREKDQPAGVFTLILRKFPDGWKIIHDHTSVEKTSQNSKVKKNK
jgi:ketosteroid isomerase-like protein